MHRIRIRNQKCAIPASRGQNIRKTNSNKFNNVCFVSICFDSIEFDSFCFVLFPLVWFCFAWFLVCFVSLGFVSFCLASFKSNLFTEQLKCTIHEKQTGSFYQSEQRMKKGSEFALSVAQLMLHSDFFLPQGMLVSQLWPFFFLVQMIQVRPFYCSAVQRFG